VTATRRPPTAGIRWLPAVVAVGLLVLVWAASAGPVRMLRDSGRRYVFEPPPPPPPSGSPSGGPGPTLREVTKDVRPLADLSWLGDLIATAILLAVAAAVLLALAWLWRHRWRPPAPPEQVDFEVLPDRLATALREDRVAQLEAVAGGDARNGIVACWLRLQETLTAAGVPPGRAETSAEYVVRVLHRLDLDPVPVARLAALYREARFSTHPVDEDARRAATEALEALHRELAGRGAVR
jgi:Domain of unknown function (DUF4129)